MGSTEESINCLHLLFLPRRRQSSLVCQTFDTSGDLQRKAALMIAIEFTLDAAIQLQGGALPLKGLWM